MEPSTGVRINETGSEIWPPESLEAASQSVVQIYCVYQANPSELLQNNDSIRWFKNDQPLLLDHTPELTTTNNNGLSLSRQYTESKYVQLTTANGYPMLIIKRPNRQDSGLYDCQVENQIGRSQRLDSRQSCQVQIQFRPVVRMRLFKLMGANNGAISGNQQQLAMNYEHQIAATINGDNSNGNNNNNNHNINEIDLSVDIVHEGDNLLLVCDTLEAEPKQINRYYWYKWQWQQQRHQSKSDNWSFLEATTTTTTDQLEQLDNKPEMAPTTTTTTRPNGSHTSGVVLVRTLMEETNTRWYLMANMSRSNNANYSCAAANLLGPGATNLGEPSTLAVVVSHKPGKCH